MAVARSTMLGRLLQIVRVCFLGEEKKTKLNSWEIRKNVRDSGRCGTFGGR